MPTKDECKRILSKLGFKLGVSPTLISTRLLSEEDKQDMMDGKLPLDALELHIRVWISNKTPNYVSRED
jgi:hypothetical protein